MNEFVIYLWATPQVEDLDAKAGALAQAGFTVVDWEPGALDVLGEYRLKGMVHKPTSQLAQQLSRHPNLWGYHCGDEPYPEEKFPPIAALFRELEEADSRHPPFVNVLSTTGEFLRTYMRIVKPGILSFDYYQWKWGSDRYYEKLEQFREAAVLAGIPLGSCLEVMANPLSVGTVRTYLPDNPLKLRQSVYTNLAYDVKMIEWFSSRALFESDSVELSPAGREWPLATPICASSARCWSDCSPSASTTPGRWLWAPGRPPRSIGSTSSARRPGRDWCRGCSRTGKAPTT